MLKSFSKIIALFLILTLNWFSLSVIGSTKASFSDKETSSLNSLKMSSLDFSLETPGDFSLNFTASEPAQRVVNIVNEGDMAFWYKVEATQKAGSLCSQVQVEAKRNGQIEYGGSLDDFQVDNLYFSSTSSDSWLFEFSFNGSVQEFKNTPCQFNLNFEARQNELNNSGFSDQESTFTHLMLRDEIQVVLNEFLPNPTGQGECSLTGLEGEWVELYNNGSQAVDLNGWYIQDAGPNVVHITPSSTLSGLTTIQPHSWLVVFMNGCVLNNSGDTVGLYNPSYQQIDSYVYAGPVPEGKSFARYPDGIGPWYDPVPTPGQPNILDQNLFFEAPQEAEDGNKQNEEKIEDPEEEVQEESAEEEPQETEESTEEETQEVEENESTEEELQEPEESTEEESEEGIQEEDTEETLEENDSNQELPENSSDENNQENEEVESNDPEEELENEEEAEESLEEPDSSNQE